MLDDESKFIKACRNYDINTIISLQNKININVRDIRGYTGFLWACKYRFKEIVNISMHRRLQEICYADFN